MSDEQLKAARRKLDELQESFARVGRELEAIRQEPAAGSKADRINALYDEANEHAPPPATKLWELHWAIYPILR